MFAPESRKKNLINEFNTQNLQNINNVGNCLNRVTSFKLFRTLVRKFPLNEYLYDYSEQAFTNNRARARLFHWWIVENSNYVDLMVLNRCININVIRGRMAVHMKVINLDALNLQLNRETAAPF